MKVFISMKVPRGDEELDRLAVLTAEVVRQAGFESFVAMDEIAKRGLTCPKDFMPFVREHAKTSDLMIVLYHPELRGGLIELGIAYANDIPVWLCYQTGQNVSSSASGCAELTVEYTHLEHIRDLLSVNLNRFY